jgi:hypothetical protein
VRNNTRFGVLLIAGLAAVVVGVVPAAAAAPAHTGVPTCLITNGGNGGHYSKAMTCVELVNQRYGSIGTGRYNPGPGHGQHSVTVTPRVPEGGLRPPRQRHVGADDVGHQARQRQPGGLDAADEGAQVGAAAGMCRSRHRHAPPGQ